MVVQSSSVDFKYGFHVEFIAKCREYGADVWRLR